MDIIYYTSELIHINKHGTPVNENEDKILPEDSIEQDGNKKKRSNAYEIDLNELSENEFDNSRENIAERSRNPGNASKSKIAAVGAGRARRR